MAVPEAADRAGLSTSAIARLLASEMREELLAIMREIFERDAFAERLAYSPDEAAELLGISRELVHDLLSTGQLGSVKAGRRRLIGKPTLKNSWPANGREQLHRGRDPCCGDNRRACSKVRDWEPFLGAIRRRVVRCLEESDRVIAQIGAICDCRRHP